MYRLAIVSTLIVVVALFSGCRPKYPSCDKDSHCQEGEYCVNSLCQQCRDGGDCPEGQECADGACREIEDYCSGSEDCAEGQVCRDSRCGPCLSAGDCQDDKVCMDGLCMTAECHSTEDCPAGLSCVGYKCQTDVNANAGLGEGDCEVVPIYFEFDSSEVTSQMRRTAEANFDCIMKRGGNVHVIGHCDNRGTTEYNMALGERRARIIAKILKTLGFEASKVRVSSKGKEEATGTSEAGMAKDRRVEFK